MNDEEIGALMNSTSINSPPEFDAAALSDELIHRNPILIERIANALNCNAQEAVDALREVLRFMFLVSREENKQLTPSHCVDMAWHEFILCTKAYQEFCEVHFGRMIHHFPGGSKAVHNEQFVRTLMQYETLFGKPEPIFWGSWATRNANCGACESF